MRQSASLTEARQTLRRAFVLGALFAVASGTFFLWLDLPADPDVPRMQTDRYPLPVPATILASILFGMGLGTQVSLLWANWDRMRAVLRPNKGRLISWIFLTGLAPVGQFWGIPVAHAFAMPNLVSGIHRMNFDEYNTLAGTMLFFLYPPLFYVFSCLIISGISRRGVRIAIFGQVWLAAYGAVLMIFGFYSGNL